MDLGTMQKRVGSGFYFAKASAEDAAALSSANVKWDDDDDDDDDDEDINGGGDVRVSSTATIAEISAQLIRKAIGKKVAEDAEAGVSRFAADLALVSSNCLAFCPEDNPGLTFIR